MAEIEKNTATILDPQFDLEKVGIGKEDIKTEIEQLINRGNKPKEQVGLFRMRPANDWLEMASKQPIPKMLFDEFWSEGELCILFADTNVGKSILAVQIGNSISKGEPILGFKMETPKQLILYFDFELNAKQFETRYSNGFKNDF